MKSFSPLFPSGLAAAALLLGAGCMAPAFNDSARIGPFFAPTNHAGDPVLGGIRRVVLMPVWGGELAPFESTGTLDPVFQAALQQQARFEIVTLSQEQCRRWFRKESISASGALPHDLLAVLRREFAADAVLFVDLTAYQVYRPLALGLRAKLAAIDGSRLIWTFDEVFSADDPSVANAARRHFLLSDRRGVPADLSPAVLQSPTRFAAYAATAMFQTLPPAGAFAATHHRAKVLSPTADNLLNHQRRSLLLSAADRFVSPK